MHCAEWHRSRDRCDAVGVQLLGSAGQCQLEIRAVPAGNQTLWKRAFSSSIIIKTAISDACRRFKDKEAAAMYENAGFTEVKRDSFIRSVVGLDRRFLMSKAVARSVDNES